MAEHQTFAAVLTQAISSSGLSLTSIANELSKQGLDLSTASLSYWKTGKSLPTRKSSLPILQAIEAICSLKPGTLVEAAKIDSQTHHNRKILTSTRHDRIPDNAHSQAPIDFKELESEIQWEYEAEREIIIDSFHISADFKQIQSEMLILARITNPLHSHLHVGSYVSTGEKGYADNETGLRYLEGATVGDVVRHENSRSITLRLDLPEDKKVGDLHRVFYLPAPYHATTPCTQSPFRHFAWHLRMYNCFVFFEGKVPENIEWVTEKTQEQNGSRIKQITTQRVQPNDNSVQITLENIQGLMGYFRWS